MQASLDLSSIYALQSGLKYTGHLRFHHSQRHSKQIESTTLSFGLLLHTACALLSADARW